MARPQHVRELPVDKEVGVTADRRGEVGVEGNVEAKVVRKGEQRGLPGVVRRLWLSAATANLTNGTIDYVLHVEVERHL